jgi:phospholipid-transporting ATPase
VVVAARVTPGQKAEFVSLVEKSIPEAKTLAVGDGANDVNMICTAKVGVAIYGKEGLQASTASDYSIPEFKMLKPLLLHHGSEFCRINQNYIYYNFYKNFLLCMPQIL